MLTYVPLMSSSTNPWVDQETSAGVQDNWSEISQDELTTEDIETSIENEMHVDVDSNSSIGSNSSTHLREVKSTADLPLKNSSTSKRRFNPKFYKALDEIRLVRTQGSQSLNLLARNNKYRKQRTLEITSYSSTEDVPNECFSIREVGNVISSEPFVCSMYITSVNPFEDHLSREMTIDPFADILNDIASGRVKIQKTVCGIIAAFTKQDDADKVIKLPLQKIFGGPVQVARFATGEHKFRRNVIIKDLPWCISKKEIYEALKMQGISAGKVIRTRAHVKIEVLNALDMQRLLEEGFNFYSCASFFAVPENSVNQGDPDIIQCFKCQGFWHTSTHCRQIPRCVRCGENHDVEYCPRPRNAPICCHCGGPHHAAYKMCPVRLQHINSTYVGFQLAKTKPNRSMQHNMF